MCFDGDRAYLYGEHDIMYAKINIWKRENKTFFSFVDRDFLNLIIMSKSEKTTNFLDTGK